MHSEDLVSAFAFVFAEEHVPQNRIKRFSNLLQNMGDITVSGSHYKLERELITHEYNTWILFKYLIIADSEFLRQRNEDSS